MKRMVVVSLAAALILLLFSLPQICIAETASEAAGMSVEQAREEIAYAVGLQAYPWGYPLHYCSRSTPKAIEVGGTYINDFRKFAELKISKDKFVVTPNNVTMDAYGTFDLTVKPVVVFVPALPCPQFSHGFGGRGRGGMRKTRAALDSAAQESQHHESGWTLDRAKAQGKSSQSNQDMKTPSYLFLSAAPFFAPVQHRGDHNHRLRTSAHRKSRSITA